MSSSSISIIIFNDQNCFVSIGSFPESDEGKIYNTCTVFNPSGNMLGKYRKVSAIGVGTRGQWGHLPPQTADGGGGALPPQPEPCQYAVLGLTMIHSMNIDSCRVYTT